MNNLPDFVYSRGRMRDDLHKTVPLARNWSRVLRFLSKERWSAAELAPVIVATAQKDLIINGQIGGGRLAEVLSQGNADLFGAGEEEMRLSLLQLQRDSLLPAERAVCETALGVLALHGMTPDFQQRVQRAACGVYARDQLEHIAARVAQTHGYLEARQVRGELFSSLNQSDVSAPYSESAFRRQKKGLEALLGSELALAEEA